MADFGNITITEKGSEALAYAQKGETLTITKIVLGDGRLPEGVSPAQVTALYGPKSEVAPQVYDVVDPVEIGADERFSVLKVGGVYKNDENLEGFDWREYGLYASTESTGEVLYAYGNAGDHAEYIPPGESNYLVERALDFYVVISPDVHVALSIDSKYFVTEDHLQQTVNDLKTWLSTLGKAAEAAKLSTARDIKVDLTSDAAASFDGSENANPGVSGELPIAHGGTGASTAEQARINLGIKETGVATDDANGLMSATDKKKLDSIDTDKLAKLGTLDIDKLNALAEVDTSKLQALLTAITSGKATQVLLANGTVKDITAMLQENVETTRTALGVVSKTKIGLVPVLPANPNVE